MMARRRRSRKCDATEATNRGSCRPHQPRHVVKISGSLISGYGDGSTQKQAGHMRSGSHRTALPMVPRGSMRFHAVPPGARKRVVGDMDVEDEGEHSFGLTDTNSSFHCRVHRAL